MATNLRAKWSYLVLLAFCLTLPWGSTGASARWPSPPIRQTPSPTPTPAALDEETLGRLVIFAFVPGEQPSIIPVGSLSDTLQAVPGGSLALALGYYECCYFFQPVPASAVWSVAPTEGVTIDPATGLLTVDPDAPSGVYTVSADVENGRRIVSTELHVFTPDENPLVGFWRETARIDCASRAEVVPTEPIQEFIFGADGTFSVTWFPFEVYQDYWGTYAFDPATGSLDLVIENGNYIPSTFDGTGTYSLDPAGRLILSDIWLGSPPTTTTTTTQTCGHILTH